jgi:hypothetical protein
MLVSVMPCVRLSLLVLSSCTARTNVSQGSMTGSEPNVVTGSWGIQGFRLRQYPPHISFLLLMQMAVGDKE